eukprot:scaffold1038_cov81-Cyclotella_meneghiniana.AAC.6
MKLPSLPNPSPILQKTAPKILSILSSYSHHGPPPQQGDDDAFSPYFRGIPSKESDSTTNATKTTARPLISAQELQRWKPTPYMPLLTSRQLELTLLEIQRRQRHYRRKQSETETVDTNTNAISSNKAEREAAIFVPICTVKDIPSVLFTRRSGSLSTHASQISFPGGYFDPSLDCSTSTTSSAREYFNTLGNNAEDRLVNAAVREMQEELCFDTAQVRQLQSCSPEDNQEQQLPFLTVLGQTQPVPSMTGNPVTPIIGQINYDLPHFSSIEFKQLFPGNSEEVDWIFTVPIQQLLDEETSEPLRKWGDHDMAKVKGKYEYWGPVFPVPDAIEKRDGDRIWGLTASVLRPLLHGVFKKVFTADNNASKL